MSWSFEVHASSRQGLRDNFAVAAASDQHVPKDGRLQNAFLALVDAGPQVDHKDHVYLALTSGHVNDDGTGFVRVEVSIAPQPPLP